jgi:hypothetical protein
MAWNCGECSTGQCVVMRLGSRWLWLSLWEEDYGSMLGEEVGGQYGYGEWLREEMVR